MPDNHPAYLTAKFYRRRRLNGNVNALVKIPRRSPAEKPLKLLWIHRL